VTGPIVRSVVVAAPAERVFRLLVEPAELVRWWPEAAEVEPRLGGRVRLVFPGGREVHGEVNRYEPPRALGFTWTWPYRAGATQVDFAVAERGGGCEVTVTHSGWDGLEQLRPQHDDGWAHYLGCLAALVDGRPFDKTFTPRKETR